ncbi:hypothetical protein SUGI_0846150 [Cryptomeria japonica]|uniref:protein RRC1 isoform X2 n=1 Tax=Cryptomeria japonica TaxID=3369 RepID=UPI00241473BD|nr:protein RRC1 isoform X2 [Cryptomeria japonica]GLJ40900.1 hypothetical protein SUGI_0846150 [Cryptomeria japonica]
MTSFSVIRKKTPFQKHREEEEAKKKRADEEAARLYEEFVESFKADDVPGAKAFVRGGTINPDDRSKAGNEGVSSKDGASGSKKGSRYIPSFIPPGLAAASGKSKDLEKKKEEEKTKEREKGKSRNIDHFMEELKAEQELREKRNQERGHRQREGRQIDNPSSRFDELPDDLDPFGKLPGSIDDGDPQTTNLYVGNLAPQVDENFLLRTFGRFGPIASVKIMWPRTEEERRRQRNCGFVAFMNREDAQAANDEMQGVVIYDYELRIGWGKSVSLPSQALPAPPPGQMAFRTKEGGTVAWSGSGAPTPVVSSQAAEVVVTPNVPDIEVIPPEDEHLRHVIDTMAMYVLDDGCPFEQAIMERVRGNQLFGFLFDLGCKEHTYYVWRLYSFAQGDTLQRWRTEPFIMITGSGRWVPPPLPQQTLTKSPEHEKSSAATYAAGRSRRLDQERALTDSQRDEFEDMLRALTLERSQIKEAMGFALDNADAAGEVVEVLTESLTLKETPIPTKVARLMLVSDILHNSSAPVKNASAYRTKFEATLPDIMESFNDLYRNITGRITAEALKERVLKALQVWSDWFLFSDTYVNGLRATFLRPGNSGVLPFHSICGDAPPVKDPYNSDSSAMEMATVEPNQDAALAMGEGAATRELSSIPLAELERRCRHNGLSIRGGREVMVTRLLSLDEAEKLARENDGYLRPEEGRWGTGERKIIHEDDREYMSRSRQSILGTREEQLMSKTNAAFGTSLQTPVTLNPKLTIPQPELKPFTSKSMDTHPVLQASKWTREDDGTDAEDKPEVKDLGLNYSSSGSEDIFGSSGNDEKREATADSYATAIGGSGMDEARRQKLRQLEAVIIEYRESLEERGTRNAEEIERKVSAYRKRLEAEYGLTDSLNGKGNKLGSGSYRHSSRKAERTSLEQKDRRDNSGDSSSKKRSRSQNSSKSPSHRLIRDTERENSEKGFDGDGDRDPDSNSVRRERNRSRDKHHDSDAEKGRERSESRECDNKEWDRDRDREKSKGRERDRDQNRERDRDREKRSRRS